jgi:hypothetical protein
MRKAGITRQQVRLVIREGRREVERYKSGELGWLSTLWIENVPVAVVWVKRKAHLVVVTVYRPGEYD